MGARLVDRLGEAFLEKNVASLNAVISLQTFLPLGDCFPCFGNLDPPGQQVFLKVPAVSKERLYVSAAPFPKQSFQCFRVKGLADVFVHARL